MVEHSPVWSTRRRLAALVLSCRRAALVLDPHARWLTRASDARCCVAEYGDLPMEFTDATLVRVAERDGLENNVHHGRRDFSVYRISGRRRFRIVP